jgi:hypothetical protein
MRTLTFSLRSAFRDAPQDTDSEFILTLVDMDSLMCNCTSKFACFARVAE